MSYRLNYKPAGTYLDSYLTEYCHPHVKANGLLEVKYRIENYCKKNGTDFVQDDDLLFLLNAKRVIDLSVLQLQGLPVTIFPPTGGKRRCSLSRLEYKRWADPLINYGLSVPLPPAPRQMEHVRGQIEIEF